MIEILNVPVQIQQRTHKKYFMEYKNKQFPFITVFLINSDRKQKIVIE